MSKQYKNLDIGVDEVGYHKEAALYEFHDYGTAYHNMDFSLDIPQGLKDFITCQFERFNVPSFPLIHEIIREAPRCVMDFVNHYEPYAWFFGLTPIIMDGDWSSFSYVIGSREISCEFIESFRIDTENDFNQSYQLALSNPGLSNLPSMLGQQIEEFFEDNDINGEPYDDGYFISNYLSIECRKELFSVCNGDINSAVWYGRLGAWATVTWFLSPEGQEYIRSRHDIIYACMELGECILYEGNVYTPREYSKLNKPPDSCIICNIRAWCVSSILDNGLVTYMCESCSNNGLLNLGPFMCGSKRCRFIECPHHTNYHQRQEGMNSYYRNYGQLRAKKDADIKLLN